MKKIIFTCLMCFLLSGCFGGRSETAKFFLLQPIGGNVLSTQKFSVGVKEAVLPDMLDRPQIVLKEAKGTQISIAETKRWAEPLSEVLQRTLVDDLNTMLPNAYIKPQQFNNETYTYLIGLEVNKMTATLNETAKLDVWWSLKNKYGRIITRQRVTFEAPVGETYSDYVMVQSVLVQRLAQQIAQRIVNR